MDIDAVIRSYIGSKYKLVGVKILKEADRKEKPAKPMRYCQFVKDASLGKTFEIELSDLTCPNAELALGFVSPRYVDVQPRIMPSETKTVRVGPIEDSDVVLMIVTPKQMMDIAVLIGGTSASFKGEIAVCGEATAVPYMAKKPNVSFLCNGARIFAGYKDSEIILGLPYGDARKLAEKIEERTKTCGALCGCLLSDIPKNIQNSFKEIGFEKGTDYFFGKIDDTNVRIYLNKDEQGRFKYITIHIPVKEIVIANEPFESRIRGNWTDIFGTFDPEALGLDLNTSENLKETISELVRKAFKKEENSK